MRKINLTINDMKVTAHEGQTLLEIARENDIFIPTLCHDERVKPFGSCLLCRVEVEGARGNLLACGTLVSEGMVVRTESAGIKEARKVCLELLVSQHYGDCKAPCSLTCPAGIDVQGYIAHIANGQYKEAIRLIKERNPLPLVCGRVCTRPCEDECRRNLVDDRVGIDYLKRFAAEYDLNNGDPVKPETLEKSGKKVAIIGAGPSGLSCSYYLSILGHDVTIFEKWPQSGGMLRYGIPEYRLPRGPLEREIELIRDLGVEIKYNTSFGKDITYPDLQKQGYKALFLGVGSQIGAPLGLLHDNLASIMTGVEFLGEVNLNSKLDFSGKKVIVIGGGNTAVDAARTSIRLKAVEVVLAYRRTRAQMPAHEMEIEEAQHEGVKLELLVAPKRIIESEGLVSGIEFIRMALGEPDESGRQKPIEVKDSEFSMAADVVIAAIGQSQDLSFINNEFPLNVVHNRIVVNPEVMTTNLEGVFAGGDVVTGPDSAIAAIAAGRKAAFSIDKYLKGEAIEKLPELYNHEKGKLKDIDSEEFLQYEKIPKEKMPMLTREERFGNFEEVELGFNEEKALREANRCLSCGCKDVNECKLREYTTKYNISQDRLKGEMKLHPIDESHEYISHDPNKCIMCGLCVRICNEVIGARVLGFNLRGYSTTITPSFDMPFGEDTRCENCGQCISVCPVGALTEKPKLIKPGPFDEVLISTTCFGCGTGCSTVQHVVGNSVIRTTAKVGVGINSGNLCEKGRFKNNSNIVEKFSRLKQPYIRENDVLVPVSFKVAFDFIRKNLKELQLANGNDSIGIVVSPSMTNEEMEAARKLAVECLKTEALGSEKISSASIGLKKSLSKAYTSANYSNIMEADYILCIGFDIKETNPVAGLLVKQAAEHGAKLTVLSYCETKLAKYATRNLSCNNDGIINLLSQADSILYEEYSKAKNPLIIIGDATADKVAEAVGNFALYFSNNAENILIMHEYCNMRGLIEIGANKKLLYENKLKGAILFDESNYLDYEKVLFKISCSDKIDILKVNTDVVLPLSELTHGPGTYTNSEGRIGEIGFSKSTKLVYSNLEIINALINILNK